MELIEVDFSYPAESSSPANGGHDRLAANAPGLAYFFITPANFLLFSCLAWHAFYDTLFFAVRGVGNPPETPDFQLVMAEIEILLGQMRIRLAPVRFNKPFVKTNGKLKFSSWMLVYYINSS
jgi:hypothetical protein